MDQARTITLDGVAYDVAQFTQGVQNAIGIYNSFTADLQKEQLAVMKTQAALQSVGAQIGEAVKTELAALAAPVDTPVLAADTADTLPVAVPVAKGVDA